MASFTRTRLSFLASSCILSIWIQFRVTPLCYLGAAANRAVEVNEMWRLREKQLELDKKLRGTRSESSSGRGHKDIRESHASTSRARSEENSASASLSSKRRSVDRFDPMEDEGLKDDEIDQFLQSRRKRGRGSIGSRMDETGPYLLPLSPDSKSMFERDNEMPNKPRVVLGPKKPYSSSESSSDDESHPHKRKESSSKRHSKKHKSKEKSKDRKKMSKDKKSKHRR